MEQNGAGSCEGGSKLLKTWSGRRGLNPRHSAWEADVLPLNYSRSRPSVYQRHLDSLDACMGRVGRIQTIPNRVQATSLDN